MIVADKYPSYKGLQPASATASRCKQNNKKTDTQHERLLRSELWRLGLRFRKNLAGLPGKPDIVFLNSRVVVFCDGDFWHGRDWLTLKPKLEQGTNSAYWPAKIARNMERDMQNTALLEQTGWHVIRVWETDVKRDPRAIASEIKVIIDARQRNLRADEKPNRSGRASEVY